MDYKKIIEGVKSLFEVQAELFVDVKTVDGQLLRIDGEIAVDSTIQIINEDATLAPLPDGDYNLEAGSMIVVAGGKIVEIKNEKTFVDPSTGEQVAELESITPEVEAAFVDAVPATEEMPEVEVETPEMDVKAKIEGLESEIGGIKEVIMQLVAAIETLTSGQATMSKQVEDFSKEPAVKTSIKEVAKFEKKFIAKETKTETNNNWASKIAQIRNK